jgi:cyclopropane fatty-acyl-phospholipid synthase-like methyltransferase
MFSSEWYDEYFRRALSSEAHARFCECVYGKNLCQHGMMDMAELDFLITLLRPGDHVLEVGCSNGYITEYIHDRVSCTLLGLDYSDVAIAQAQDRTRDKADTLRFARVDLTQEPIPGDGYDAILAIDSIYFMGEFEDTLSRLVAKLNRSGRLLLSVFQSREEGDPDDILTPEHTHLARALAALGLSYTWHDFTENMSRHWLENYRVANELRSAFLAEGNAFLYEARASESAWFRERVDMDILVRFMYVVDKG